MLVNTPSHHRAVVRLHAVSFEATLTKSIEMFVSWEIVVVGSRRIKKLSWQGRRIASLALVR